MPLIYIWFSGFTTWAREMKWVWDDCWISGEKTLTVNPRVRETIFKSEKSKILSSHTRSKESRGRVEFGKIDGFIFKWLVSWVRVAEWSHCESEKTIFWKHHGFARKVKIILSRWVRWQKLCIENHLAVDICPPVLPLLMLLVFQLFLSVEMQKERGGGEGRAATKEGDGRRWDSEARLTIWQVSRQYLPIKT